MAAGIVLWLVVAQQWGLVAVWWAVTAMVAARLAVLALAYPSALRSAT